MRWVSDWVYSHSVKNFKGSGLTLEVFKRQDETGRCWYRSRIKEWHEESKSENKQKIIGGK